MEWWGRAFCAPGLSFPCARNSTLAGIQELLAIPASREAAMHGGFGAEKRTLQIWRDQLSKNKMATISTQVGEDDRIREVSGFGH